MITVTILIKSIVSNSASFQRIMEYSKGLVFNRQDVEVHFISLDYCTSIEESQFLDYDNIHIETPSTNRKSRNPIYGLYYRLKKFNCIIKSLHSDCRNIFILYAPFDSAIEECYFIAYLKKKKIRVLSERNERALGMAIAQGFMSRSIVKTLFSLGTKLYCIFSSFIKDRLVCFYDGNIVISKSFLKWITQYNSNNLLIPTLCDCYKTKNVIITNDVFQIGYFGSINKDRGIYQLLDCAYLLKQKAINHFVINIYGSCSYVMKQKIMKRIEILKIDDVVSFYGEVDHVYSLLLQQKQDCLLLINKSTLQTEYGFSTKFAEYMYSGKVVITTAISNNYKYISDGENGFLTKFDSTSLAMVIEKCMFLPESEKDAIGLAAHNTAAKYFNIRNYAAEFQQFVFNE